MGEEGVELRAPAVKKKVKKKSNWRKLERIKKKKLKLDGIFDANSWDGILKKDRIEKAEKIEEKKIIIKEIIR